MKALAVFAMLLGVMALLQQPADFSREESGSRAIAVNYAIYRNEVFRHVHGQLFHGSFALGQANSGRLVPAPAHGTPVPVPGFIPDGSLVSVTEVDR